MVKILTILVLRLIALNPLIPLARQPVSQPRQPAHAVPTRLKGRKVEAGGAAQERIRQRRRLGAKTVHSDLVAAGIVRGVRLLALALLAGSHCCTAGGARRESLAAQAATFASARCTEGSLKRGDHILGRTKAGPPPSFIAVASEEALEGKRLRGGGAEGTGEDQMVIIEQMTDDGAAAMVQKHDTSFTETFDFLGSDLVIKQDTSLGHDAVLWDAGTMR